MYSMNLMRFNALLLSSFRSTQLSISLPNWIFSFLVLVISSIPLSAQPAPDFTITGTDGATHSLYADYLDQDKTVVLKLMFVTCPPCNAIAPSMEILYQEWGGGMMDVEFISLSILSIDSNADVLGYENLHNLTFPGAGSDGGAGTAVALYTDGSFGQFLGTPTFVVIAPDGTVQWNPSGSGISATIMALDAAIAATGAVKPGSQGPLTLAGAIQTESGTPISGVNILYQNNGEELNQTTPVDGAFEFGNITAGSHPMVQASKNTEADNGVNILDLFQIQKHILNTDTLDSPYKIIAADANANSSVNILDVFLLQKIILNIDTVFSQNNSWRFVRADHEFPDPLNPVLTPAIESIEYENIMDDQLMSDFVAIKIGDVNETADPANFQNAGETRSEEDLLFTTPQTSFNAGQTYTIDFKAPNLHQYLGFQFSLQFDENAMNILGVTLGDRADEIGLSTENFALDFIDTGVITTVWVNSQGVSEEPESVIFSLEVEALSDFVSEQSFLISSILTLAMAIHVDGSISDVDLDFSALTDLKTVPNQSLQLFPNPSQDVLHLQWAQPLREKGSLRVFHPNGQVKTLRSIPMSNSTQLNLPVSTWSKGLYFLELWEGDKTIGRRKLMVY